MDAKYNDSPDVLHNYPAVRPEREEKIRTTNDERQMHIDSHRPVRNVREIFYIT